MKVAKLISIAIVLCTLVAFSREPVTIKVMTWNIWGKLNQDPRYTINGRTGRDRVIEIIRESKADIITMTETYGSAAEIAEALDFHFYTPSSDATLAIFSKYPLERFGNLKNLSPISFIQATLKLPNNRKVKVYNIWLTSGGRHIVEIKTLPSQMKHLMMEMESDIGILKNCCSIQNLELTCQTERKYP